MERGITTEVNPPWRGLSRYAREGGAWARMLRCKTDSANEPAKGGPVSSSSCGSCVSAAESNSATVQVWIGTKFWLAISTTFASPVIVARSILQQGISSLLLFFDGVGWFPWQCIGATAEFVLEMSPPNAQWFEIESHAAKVVRTTANRITLSRVRFTAPSSINPKGEMFKCFLRPGGLRFLC